MLTGNDDDDPPMADPKIRDEYEAALGRLLVAFNRVDNELSDLIGMALSKLGRADLIRTCAVEADFSKKLLYIDLLSLSTWGSALAGLPLREMKELAGQRNILAHGHFEQNPFDGDYFIKGKGRHAPFSATTVNGLTDRCDRVWEAVRYATAHYWFDDLDASPPSGTV